MPMIWYSKRQKTLESSSSEFVAHKIAIELNEALRTNLRMLGIPLDGFTSLHPYLPRLNDIVVFFIIFHYRPLLTLCSTRFN